MIDLLDPHLFARGEAHPAFARLRAESPVSWQPTARGGFWAVVRHPDIVRVLEDDVTFSSARGTGFASRWDAEVEPPAFRSLNASDGADHVALRKLLGAAMPPLPDPTARAAALCARDGVVDVVTQIADVLTTETLAAVLGLDDAQRRAMLAISHAAARHEDAEERGDVDGGDAWRTAERTLMGMIEAWIAHPPGEGLIARLCDAPLAPRDLAFLIRLVVQTGHHTTSLAIGGAALALALDPSLQDALVSAPLDRAADELLRWTSPVIRFGRYATRDVELESATVRAGERVVVFFPSANRDERAFDAPDRIDLARTPNPHLAFGAGPHLCFGARLARAQLVAVLAALRGRPLALAAPPSWLRSSFNAGPKRLPLRIG